MTGRREEVGGRRVLRARKTVQWTVFTEERAGRPWVRVESEEWRVEIR